MIDYEMYQEAVAIGQRVLPLVVFLTMTVADKIAFGQKLLRK